jgi:nucleotide-binding universal stress UspA family protein
MGREDSPAHNLIAAALFNTGRPVLLVPPSEEPITRQMKDKIVALAWDGSLQAAHALHNALPLLQRTEKLHVLVAHETKMMDLEAENELMHYLRAQGLKMDIISVDCAWHTTGEALLAKAKELKSDLLVMGAYGHSMYREMILGGVTEHMLDKADIPLLLSH